MTCLPISTTFLRKLPLHPKRTHSLIRRKTAIRSIASKRRNAPFLKYDSCPEFPPKGGNFKRAKSVPKKHNLREFFEFIIKYKYICFACMLLCNIPIYLYFYYLSTFLRHPRAKEFFFVHLAPNFIYMFFGRFFYDFPPYA